MKHIWTPWRMPYVTGKTKEDQCVFCQMMARHEECDPENYVLYRGRHVFCVLNLYPYNNGHLLVVPYDHVSSPELLAPEVQADMMHLVSHCVDLIRRSMDPFGFNIGANVGKAAGAGIEDHLHIHVVPRWHGDTNFMPVVAETRVIPEWLGDTYGKLKVLIEEFPPPC